MLIAITLQNGTTIGCVLNQINSYGLCK